MVGGELLVTLAKGQRLRGLHEAAGAVRVFLDVHSIPPSACSSRPEGARRTIVIGSPCRINDLRQGGLPGPSGTRQSKIWEPSRRRERGLPSNFIPGLRPRAPSLTTAAMARLESIYRYPVKGLSPERLERVQPRAAGAYFPGDRLYAIENGPSGFDPAAPVHLPKTQFLMLMRNERLATLRTRYDDATHACRSMQDGREAVRAATSPPGRPAGDRGVLPPLHAARTARPARRCWRRRRLQFLGRSAKVRLDHQSGIGRGESKRWWALPVQPAALPRQPLCARLAGLERVRSGRTASSRSAPRG